MSSRLIIEDIATEESLREVATKADLEAVAPFGSEERRREVLAWRAIVRRELGEGVHIFYDEYGAPKVDIPNIYISISHSRGYVALLISDGSCSVDIENADRDFRKVASRYLSTGEMKLAEKYNLFAEMWCAKEALYKYYKKGRLDFVRDISISDYDEVNRSLTATILGSSPIVVHLGREKSLVVATITL